MARAGKYVIPAVLATVAWGARARADTPTDNAEPSAPTWTDADLLKLSEETVVIYDERPDKPFDRDTEVRLTGEQLAARGAVDLGSALALLSDVTVRDAGRGGFNVDIRGGRKGEVAVLVDGVLVTDPYYGTFDVSTIPITDIVQIRISTTPSSPIDGPGGPGGVIEVHTRDGVGPQIVIARLSGDTLPSFTMTGTARVALAKKLGLRVSASGLDGAHDYALTNNLPNLPEQRHAASGAARLEYRDGDRRIVVDGFVDDRHYIPPPADAATSAFSVIDRETSERLSAKADDKVGKLQLQAQGWVHYLYRRSRFFSDVGLVDQTAEERLSAFRTGGMALATAPIAKEWRWVASTTIDGESATDTTAVGTGSGSTTVIEPAADIQYEHSPVRADAAVGLAVPFGFPSATPWPEAKLDVKYKPTPDLQLSATAGRKGRVPSLRERFDPIQGNPMVGPEQINHVEVRAIEHVEEHVHVEAAPFFRYQTGTIKAGSMMFDQTPNLRVYGIDLIGRVRPHPIVEVGAGYDYIRAKSDTSVDAIDRLPRHKLEGWVQATPDPRVAVLARVKYFGRDADGANPDMSQRYVTGYTLVEASASAQLSKEYLGVLRVDDLLDARPETRFGFHSPGRVISLIVQGAWE